MKQRNKNVPKKFDLHRTRFARPHNDGELPAEGLNANGLRHDEKPKKRFTWKRALLALLVIILVPILVIGVWDFMNFSSASKKLFGSDNAASLLTPDKPQSTANNRTNILLVGYSADDPGHGGAKLTDSIMIMSLDKDNKTGYTLSIPRDLYVDIPGYGHAKINEAYQDGEQERGKAADGMHLLEKVIENNFGIKTHYYVIIDYGAVKDIVNALGGVEVMIKSDDPRGIYDPNFLPKEGGALKLKNGQHTINGQTALKLTRARGSTYGSYGFPQSDFNRTQNQQQVLAAIKQKMDWKLVLDPRTNGKIFRAVASNVKTDIKISEVLSLYRLFNSVPNEQLKTITLNNVNKVNLLSGYQTPTGQSALIPAAGIDDFSQIQKALQKLGL